MEWNDDVQPEQPDEETQELRHAPASPSPRLSPRPSLSPSRST